VRIIAGEWGGRRLKAPPGRDTRPTTDRIRESWFSALGSAVEGARVLDLFAGSGALGLEALSRGAHHATFVERARKPLSALEGNVASLGAGSRCRVFRGEALGFVRRLEPGAFDLALADPPYEGDFAQELLNLWGNVPFATELWVEHRTSNTLALPEGARQRRYGDTTLTVVRSLLKDARGEDDPSPEIQGVDS
jgi:16S rRNA (guanine966-N2)-methyltransferase